MAGIALDSANGGASGSVSPLTWTHTCTGQNRALFVVGFGNANVTGITYNGVALTKIKTVSDPNYGVYEVWGLLNPASGANTVSCTLQGGVTANFVSLSYTGVGNIHDSDATNSLSNVSTITTNITTKAGNCWIIGTTVGQSAPSAGSGETLRFSRTSGFGQSIIYDSNGAVAAGSNSLTTNFGGSVATTSTVLVSFAPVASGGAFLFNLLF